MQVYLGSNHFGFELKKQVKEYLSSKYQGEDDNILDLGVFSNDATEYPDIAREVSEKVLENKGAFGILICNTGIGMSISANRHKGVRAVIAHDNETALSARMNNNANILIMGAKMTSIEVAKVIVDTFLETKFAGDERDNKNQKTEISKDQRNTPHEGTC